MEFQVINRSRNAVIPEGMFKLCGMEDVKLISMAVSYTHLRVEGS